MACSNRNPNLRKAEQLQNRKACLGSPAVSRTSSIEGELMLQHWAIETRHLGRTFKKKGKNKEQSLVVALDEVSLQIAAGELFGLLGPNGAGKTTLIKILVTLLFPSSGEAFVDGFDVVRAPQAIRPRIAMVTGGEHSGYGVLTVRETLWMFSQFYGVPGGVAAQRIDEMLKIVGLEDQAHTKIHALSSGMRQKMNFARGFVSDPKILFLDEPTLGLDVGTSRVLRRYIREWVKTRPNKTILLTTHYMAEADELCDRVAIIDRGRILACDTPANLKKRLQHEALFRLQVTPLADPTFPATMPGVRNYTHRLCDGHLELRFILESEQVLPALLAAITERDAHLISLEKREPTLEDVFVALVGRTLEDTAFPLDC